MRAFILAAVLVISCFGVEPIVQNVCNSVSVTIIDGNTSRTATVTQIRVNMTLFSDNSLLLQNPEMRGELTFEGTYENTKTKEVFHKFNGDSITAHLGEYLGSMSLRVLDPSGIWYIIDYMCIRSTK